MKHAIGAIVTIVVSKTNAAVIGRAEYAFAESCYLCRYVTAQGDPVEQWWGESALVETAPATPA